MSDQEPFTFGKPRHAAPEQIPHSGVEGYERPAETFDNTTLEQAIEQGRLSDLPNEPDHPALAPLEQPKVEKSVKRWKKVAPAVALVLGGTIAGGVTVAAVSGNTNSESSSSSPEGFPSPEAPAPTKEVVDASALLDSYQTPWSFENLASDLGFASSSDLYLLESPESQQQIVDKLLIDVDGGKKSTDIVNDVFTAIEAGIVSEAMNWEGRTEMYNVGGAIDTDWYIDESDRVSYINTSEETGPLFKTVLPPSAFDPSAPVDLFSLLQNQRKLDMENFGPGSAVEGASTYPDRPFVTLAAEIENEPEVTSSEGDPLNFTREEINANAAPGTVYALKFEDVSVVYGSGDKQNDTGERKLFTGNLSVKVKILEDKSIEYSLNSFSL